MADILPEQNNLIHISEAARLLGVSLDTLRRWDKAGNLHSIRNAGNARYFSKEEISNLIKNRHLSVGEAAKEFGISASTLRRLEKRGIISSERDKNGERFYTPEKLRSYLQSDYFLNKKQRQNEKRDVSLSPQYENFSNESEQKEKFQKIEEASKPPLKEITPAPQPINDNEEKILKIVKETEEISKQTKELVRDSTLINMSDLLSVNGRVSETNVKVFEAQQKMDKVQKSIRSFKFIRKFFFVPIALIILYFLVTTLASTIFLITNPKGFSEFFGYWYNSNSVNENDQNVLAASDIKDKDEGVTGTLVSTILKPASSTALKLVRIIDPEKYMSILPLEGVNEIFFYNDEGNITPKNKIEIHNSSYLVVSDSGLIENLNSEYLRGKTWGTNPGDLVALDDEGNLNIKGIITSTSIDSVSVEETSINSTNIIDGSIFNNDLAGDSVTSDEILNGEVKKDDLADNSVNSKKIIDESITSSDIEDNSIQNEDLEDSSVSVLAGAGLIDGGSVSLGSSVSLTIGAGDGIVIGADTVGINLATSGATGSTSSNSGLEVSSNGLSLLKGCSNNQILKWDDSSSVWNCAADSGGGGSSVWSDLTDPSANLNLSYAEYTTGFNWNTASTAAGFDAFTLSMTNDATVDSNTQRVLVVQNNSATGGTTERLLVLDNADDSAVTTALEIVGSSTGAINTAVDLSDTEITTALALGSNDVTVGGVTLQATELALLESRSGTLVDSANVSTYATTGVTAGSGLTGGGTVGLLTVNIGAGNGITVNADDIAIDAATSGTTVVASSNSGIESTSTGIRLLGGCSSGQVLAWNSGSLVWECTTTSAGGDITVVGSMESGAAFADSTADDDWLGLGSLAGRIEFDDQSVDEVNVLSAYVGIGTNAPNNPLEILSTTATQVRVAYDTSNYFTQAVSSAGAVTFDATGSSAGFTFSDNGIFNGTATFNSDADLTLAGSENLALTNTSASADQLSLTSTIADTNSVDIFSITVTDNTVSSGVGRGLFIETGNGTATLDAAVAINHTDTGQAMTSGITITGDASTAITTAINLADDEIGTALALGSNDLTVGGVTLESGELALLDARGGVLVDSINVGTYATTGVTAGSGLTGGGTNGVLTVDVGAGNGITVNTDDIAVDAITSGTTLTISANSGIEVTSAGVRLLGGCSNSQVLAWNSGSSAWECTSAAAGDITAVGSMESGSAFADSTADDDWLGLGALAGRIEFDDQSVDEVNVLSAYVGIGTNAPNNPLEVLSTTATQVRVAYDTSNYFTQAVSSAGAVTFDATGSSAGFTFSDNGIFNGTATFNSDADLTLAGSENLALTNTSASADQVSLTSTIADTNSVDIFSITVTDNTVSSGTGRGLFIETGNGSATLDAAIAINHTDTGQAMTSGITITGDASTTITTAVDVSDDQITTALALGSNDVTVGGVTLESGELALLDARGGVLVDSINVGTYATTGVTAGSGLTGGGTNGALTVNVGAGNGITVNTDDITIDATTSGTTTTTTANSGLEVTSGGLRLLGGCAENQVLEWIGGNWVCDNDDSSAGAGISTIEIGNSSITTAASRLDFSATDFDGVTDGGVAEADISIDYTNSGITRKNQSETISNDWTFSLAETEDLAIDVSISGSNSGQGEKITLTNSSSSGSQYGLYVDNAASSGTTDALVVIDNSDTDTAVTTGLQFVNAGGGFTTGIEITGAATDISTTNNEALTLAANGTGDIILSADSDTAINFGTTSFASCDFLGTNSSGDVTCSTTGFNVVSAQNTNNATWADDDTTELWATDANLQITVSAGSEVLVMASYVTTTVDPGSVELFLGARIDQSGSTSACADGTGSTVGVPFQGTGTEGAANDPPISVTGSVVFVDTSTSAGGTFEYEVCTDGNSTSIGGGTWVMDIMELTLIEVNDAGDLAEIYPTNDPSLEAGEIVSLEPDGKISVQRSSKAYDKNAIGVIATRPAMVIGGRDGEGIDGKPVALAGRVPVKVSTENGPIKKGDALTSSSIPGVAMKTTKAGHILGVAMTEYDGKSTGTVILFVKTGNYNGSNLAELIKAPSDVSQKDVGRLALQHFVNQKEQFTETPELSEVVSDRIAAGLEIITPSVITQSLLVDKIGSSLENNITLNLNENGEFILTDAAEEKVISFDSLGNAYFKGVLTAGKIKAENIEGLEILADRFISSTEVAQESTQSFNSNALNSSAEDSPNNTLDNSQGLTLDNLTVSLDLKVLQSLIADGSLTVLGPTTLKGELLVEGKSTFGGNSVFKEETEFEKDVTFNKNLAGYAVVKKGMRRVNVKFEKELGQKPLVTASPLWNTSEELLNMAENDDILVLPKQDFIVANVSKSGFTILLQESAIIDMEFSWIAVQVLEPTTFESTSQDAKANIIVENPESVSEPQRFEMLPEDQLNLDELTDEVSSSTQSADNTVFTDSNSVN